MKKHLAFSFILAGTLALAACSSSTPTATPSATPTSRVTEATTASGLNAPSTFPRFAAKTYHGTGDALITMPAPAALLTYSTKADPDYAGFAVDLLDASNKDTGSLFTTYGNTAVRGTTSVGVTNHISGDSDSLTTRLRVKSGTKWTLTLHPVADVKLGMPVKGTGDDVYYVEKPTADANVTAKNAGNFTITAINAMTGENTLLVNETKKYAGVVPFENAAQYLVIQASGTGTWTVK